MLRSLHIMLRTLRRNLYSLSSAGSSVGETPDPDPLAPARYACLYWVDHSTHSPQDLDDNGPVHWFLTEHLLHWLEALSLLWSVPSGIQAISKLLLVLKSYPEETSSINQTTRSSKSDKGRLVTLVHDA